jgi:Diaminopimelate decarboxylase
LQLRLLQHPAILKILQEEGCGVDCSSYVELLMSHKLNFPGSEIMFSSNNTPDKEYAYARELVRPLTWMHLKILNIWSEQQAFQKSSHVVTILEAFLN